jgi:thiol-disulfide isomerase/thioredoxin
MIRILLSCAALGLAAIGAVAQPQTTEPAERARLGSPAPGVRFNLVQSGPVKLQSDWAGKVHVVEFWATWCGPCRYSAPHLTELQETYGDDGLIVLGISDETEQEVMAFAKEMGDQMRYNLVIDPTRQTHQNWMGAFGVSGIPHAFLVDKQGRIVWHGHPMDEMMEIWIKRLLDVPDKQDEKTEASDDADKETDDAS